MGLTFSQPSAGVRAPRYKQIVPTECLLFTWQARDVRRVGLIVCSRGAPPHSGFQSSVENLSTGSSNGGEGCRAVGTAGSAIQCATLVNRDGSLQAGCHLVYALRRMKIYLRTMRSARTTPTRLIRGLPQGQRGHGTAEDGLRSVGAPCPTYLAIWHGKAPRQHPDCGPSELPPRLVHRNAVHVLQL